AKLTPEQRKQLEAKLKQQNIDVLKLPITKVDRPGDRQNFPLTFEQERLWFIQQLDPGNSAYNIIKATQFEGKLDKQALELGIAELIRRHDILRTIFINSGDGPKQVVLNQLSFQLEIIELNAVPFEEQKEKINQIIDSEALYIFNLEKGPLFRTKLLALNKRDDEHIFLLTVHHIIADGTSIQVIIGELKQLYQAFSQRKETGLSELPIQYIDYACWQRFWFGEIGTTLEFIKKQETYWLEQFQGELPILTLPTDYTRPVSQSFEGKTASFYLTGEVTRALKEMTKKWKTTLYVVLLAIYNVFLAKLSGMEDIIVGTPVAGRRHPDLQGLVGMFVNTLVLRNYPFSEQRFYEFLEVVRNRAIEAFENQEYPYESLLGKLEISRNMGRNPLFDVMFFIDNVIFAEIDIEGLKWNVYEYEDKAAHFDITFVGCEVEIGGIQTLRFDWQYSTKLFKETTVDRFSGYFKEVVNAVLNNIEIQIAEIEIISSAEKEKILYEFNDTAVEYPKDKTIHELFTEQAAQTPDYIALHGCMIAWMDGEVGANRHLRIRPSPNARNVSLTYHQLNEHSDRLAGVLMKKGVLPDTIVGIMVERSIEMIIGIIGILKSGGAYLPIDPEYPQERIDYMLKDSNAVILLTDEKKNHYQLSIAKSQLSMSESWAAFHQHSAFDLPRILHSNRLAYVIYTSGTTGRPKGVLVEHGSIFNTIQWRKQEYNLGNDNRVLQLFSFAFDGFLTSCFTPIVSGASVVQLSASEVKDINHIKKIIVSLGITHFICVPSLYRLLLEVSSNAELFRLKIITLAGEQIQTDLIKKSKQLNPLLEIVNEYGPTEGSVVVSYCRNIRIDEVISIGKPIHNVGIYIINKNENIIPIGISGEIVIFGKSLARGYLNNPELTAEKFDQDLWDEKDGQDKCGVLRTNFHHSKLYHSGDLARWLPDGNIEFLGRIDQQVKIRGFRIELGEIENRLVKHGQIKEAAVLIKIDTTGDKYLAAYFVSGQEISTSELKKYLSKDLPDYMIPLSFTRLEKIPLTPSGKVNRRALPEPGLKTQSTYMSPRDEMEKKLVEIWSEILGKNLLGHRIGIDDNFFQLGGHSLKATVLISKIHKELNVKIALVEIFKTPTIRTLSNYINALVKDKYVSIKLIEKKEYYAMSSSQKRLYVLYQIDQESVRYNMPSFSVLSGEIDKNKFENIFKHLIIRHESLRTSFHIINEDPVQRIHNEVEFEIEYLATEATEEHGHKQSILKNFIRPFDLVKTPLLRVALLKENENRHILMIDM
ncbi:MAG: amino acid adenylation domain-containing protein, partial [Acidobacteria bacterium]|nr:amino acid adenylation domain-containing protein [Acidobacteriota bacterium]